MKIVGEQKVQAVWRRRHLPDALGSNQMGEETLWLEESRPNCPSLAADIFAKIVAFLILTRIELEKKATEYIKSENKSELSLISKLLQVSHMSDSGPPTPQSVNAR